MNEPHVAIVRHLLPQMQQGGILIPEAIKITASLGTRSTINTSERNDLGEVFCFDWEMALAEEKKEGYLKPKSLTLPKEIASDERLYLLTEIKIYDEIGLSLNESSLNIPVAIEGEPHLRQGEALSFQYHFRGVPRLELTPTLPKTPSKPKRFLGSPYVKFPHLFASNMMLKELDLKEDSWQPHYVPKHYEGAWDVIPLRTAHDGMNAITAVEQDVSAYEDTPLLKASPTTQKALEAIPAKKGSVRLMRLNPNSLIKEHVDDDLGFSGGSVRLHIPLSTNEQTMFYTGECAVNMECGTLWYIDASQPHRVENLGTTPRIHLVIDCELSDALRALFWESGYQPAEKRPYHKGITDENIHEVLRNLEAMGGEGAHLLAQQLQRDLSQRGGSVD